MAQTSQDASRLIAGQFAVDLNRPMPAWGAGLECYLATDVKSGRADNTALLVRRDAPLRAQAVGSLAAMPIDGILTPIAHGPGIGPGGVPAWFVIAHAPPGAPLAAASGAPLAAWHEHELLTEVLRPVAHALERLQARHVTHRGIRPENLFRAQPGDPVTLGCAWAAPAASMQPAIYEPPYVAMCLAGGRGEGSIGDDVYALGVTLLVLFTGRVPMAGMDDASVIRRKLEVGSFAALAGEERLSPAIGDLIRGMLAEDPDHRPPPVLLADPAAARARRVAARPPPRASRALQVSEEMQGHIKAGALGRMLELLDNPEARKRDAGEAGDAVRLMARIDAEIAELEHAASARAAVSQNVGHELVLGVGMTALRLPSTIFASV